jgi:hypothetical protein
MSCIKKAIVQKYADGEASPAEVAKIEKHIAACEKCAAMVDHQRKLASVIKKAVNLLSEETMEIPKILLPSEPAKRHFITVRRIIYMAAAACILLFILILRHKKEPERQAEIILLEPGFSPEFDANRPVSQQQIVITIIDAEGNRSEYIQ